MTNFSAAKTKHQDSPAIVQVNHDTVVQMSSNGETGLEPQATAVSSNDKIANGDAEQKVEEGEAVRKFLKTSHNILSLSSVRLTSFLKATQDEPVQSSTSSSTEVKEAPKQTEKTENTVEPPEKKEDSEPAKNAADASAKVRQR